MVVKFHLKELQVRYSSLLDYRKKLFLLQWSLERRSQQVPVVDKCSVAHERSYARHKASGSCGRLMTLSV